MKILKCTDVDKDLVYQAFDEGFSDYMIKIKLDKDVFFKHFFEIEGNELELSYIAVEEGRAVGICLGGMKRNESRKTLRCGGMSVVPSHRRMGIGQMLMDHHLQLAKDLGCEQAFLEVIYHNEPAYKMYEKLGYERNYELTYWQWHQETFIETNEEVVEITRDEMMALRDFDDSHLPWQGCFEYTKGLPVKYYGFKVDGEIVGGVVLGTRRIFYVFVRKEYRNKGYGRKLFSKACETNPKFIMFSHANNAMLHRYAKKLGMVKDSIAQRELYYYIK